MMSPFDLLKAGPVDLEKSSDALSVIEFADDVVSTFYDGIRAPFALAGEYHRPLLRMSWDKFTVGEAPEAAHSHSVGSQSRSGWPAIALRKGLTAAEVATVFSFDEHEMRVALMMINVNLQEIELEGSTREAERAVDQSVEHLRGLLGYALRFV